MQVAEGYKQTEVGVIPEDWETYTLKQITLDILQGVNTAIDIPIYVLDGVPMLKANNVIDQQVKFDGASHISRQTFSRYSDRFKARKNDFLFSNIGARLGTGSILTTNTECSFAWNVMRIVPNPNKVEPVLLSSLMNSPLYSGMIKDSQSGSGMGFVPKTVMQNLVLALPPTLAEQEAIAEALSDADSLIESLQQLIAKKRQIKQGAMQELLQPKPDWVEKALGELADTSIKWSFTGGPFGSNLKSSDYTNDGVRIVQLQNIGDGRFKLESQIYTSLKKANELVSCNIYPNEIILSKMGDPVARACIVPNAHTRYLMCSDGIRLAVNKKQYNTFFIFTLLNAPTFREKAYNAGTGSTRRRIGLKELRTLTLYVPPLEKQTRIATILSDMDSEITSLETKLTKAQQIKQGMMSELLTGKTRLI